MICHQRKLRDDALDKDDCALGDNLLRDCVIEQISRREAAEIIMRYEWLKSMPQVGRAYYGLFTPGKHAIGSHKLIGAACFGAGPSRQAGDFCGEENRDRIICLERGACAPIRATGKHADNAASYLITHACRAASKDYGWGGFYAYSDGRAGEIGTVYQAANWLYIGQGVGRKNDGSVAEMGRFDYFSPTGERHTSRRMRAKLAGLKAKGEAPVDWTLKEWFSHRLEQADWYRERQHEKHKYVLLLDKDLRESLRYKPQPYPKREDGSVGAALADWRTHRWPTYIKKEAL